MERHKCKLCFKSFANGRALGGHMRSHMLNLPVPPKTEPEEEEDPHNQLSEEADSASSSSSSDEEEIEEPEGEENSDKGLSHGLRENPKRSIRLGDPEFSFVVDAGSVVLQDRESETESFKNPTRRRSKRTRKLIEHHQYYNHQNQEHENFKKLKFHKLSNNNNKKKSESWVEPEPVSSISDATTEEDVAFCLMMLSRDKWKRKEKLLNEQEHEELEAEEETYESDEFKSCKTRTRGKYRCETCKKSFKSYQALGGHRASHKKIKATINVQEPELLGTENNADPQKKIHECPYCYRVFSSGQALGGHKRSHGITGSGCSAPPPPVAATTTTPARSSTIICNSFIDLNLPAPMDEDDISQIELSALSDA